MKKVVVPESGLLEAVMRVRQVVELTYHFWLAVMIFVYGALLLLPLATIVLLTFGITDASIIVSISAATSCAVGILLIADPRPRAARAYVAAHQCAWPARMDAVTNPDDPDLPRRVLPLLRRAAHLIQSTDALALVGCVQKDEEDAQE